MSLPLGVGGLAAVVIVGWLSVLVLTTLRNILGHFGRGQLKS